MLRRTACVDAGKPLHGPRRDSTNGVFMVWINCHYSLEDCLFRIDAGLCWQMAFDVKWQAGMRI